MRAARGGHTILGTSITCSAIRKSRGARMSTNCSTICGTNTWSNGETGTGSTICSTVNPFPAAAPQATVLAARRLVPHPRPPRHPSQSTGHQPPGGGHLPEHGRTVHLAPPPPALAIVCLRRAEWWLFSAKAIATLRRSCRSHCLSRRLPPPRGSRCVSITNGTPT